MKFKPWAESNLLLEYKFIGSHSSKCVHCRNNLIVSGISENNKHVYTIGQDFKCNCGKSSIWTNSIRSPEALLMFLRGESDRYYRGFCNDLFCGLCHSYLVTKQTGYSLGGERGDKYGCTNETCPNQGIVIFEKIPEGTEATQKFIQWYKSMLPYWENMV